MMPIEQPKCLFTSFQQQEIMTDTGQILTSIVPPVWNRRGLRTFLCTIKLGRQATGGTSVIPATLILNWEKHKTAVIHVLNLMKFGRGCAYAHRWRR